ncbi:hypothetical protein O1L60_44835 [Streptomyces diastatochromogenes]|nr:hypothetical protein [Streptomyces diastatochromogenes]
MTTALLPAAARAASGAPRPRPAAPVRRGRGRPRLDEPGAHRAAAVRHTHRGHGRRSAAAAGLSRTPVYSLRRNDPLFAAALTQAQAAGRAARRAAGPALQVDQHGTESSYTKRNCPCTACRAAGTQARARRRAGNASPLNTPAAKAA